jgi:hypothetical protein
VEVCLDTAALLRDAAATATTRGERVAALEHALSRTLAVAAAYATDLSHAGSAAVAADHSPELSAATPSTSSPSASARSPGRAPGSSLGGGGSTGACAPSPRTPSPLPSSGIPCVPLQTLPLSPCQVQRFLTSFSTAALSLCPPAGGDDSNGEGSVADAWGAAGAAEQSPPPAPRNLLAAGGVGRPSEGEAGEPSSYTDEDRAAGCGAGGVGVVAATWGRAEKELHAALRELIRASASAHGHSGAEADLEALKAMYRVALCEREHRGPTGLLRCLVTLNAERRKPAGERH